MSKNVMTVRKPMAERVFICIFSALLLIIVTICVVHLNTPVALLLFVPMLLILLPLLLFSLTWQVRFDEKQIVKVLFFHTNKVYRYTQLQEVTQQHFTSEHGSVIRMDFADGKSIRFRIEDDGAKQAIKLLCKHHSIQRK